MRIHSTDEEEEEEGVSVITSQRKWDRFPPRQEGGQSLACPVCVTEKTKVQRVPRQSESRETLRKQIFPNGSTI